MGLFLNANYTIPVVELKSEETETEKCLCVFSDDNC